MEQMPWMGDVQAVVGLREVGSNTEITVVTYDNKRVIYGLNTRLVTALRLFFEEGESGRRSQEEPA